MYALQNFLHLFLNLRLHWVFTAAGISLAVASGGYSLVEAVGVSLQWRLLLPSAGSRARGDSSCGAWAELLLGTWSLLGPGLEP